MGQGVWPRRVGDLFLKIKGSLAKGKLPPLLFALYDQMDGSGGRIPLAVQRKEHVEMWALLGDPAMKLPEVKQEIVLDGPIVLEPGKAVQVTGSLPERAAGWRVLVSLHRVVSDTPRLKGWNGANTTEELTAEVVSAGRWFEAAVRIAGEDARERLIVRAVARQGREAVTGSAWAEVKRGK